MSQTKCGFGDVPGGASGAVLLTAYGPTIIVDIGFDPNFKPGPNASIPVPGITGIHALVDTGAGESCIDSLLAAQLNLPIVDRRPISGVHGPQEVNMHLAQVYIPSLGQGIYGVFAGVHLSAGGQIHKALIGRTFFRTILWCMKAEPGQLQFQIRHQPPANAGKVTAPRATAKDAE